MTGLLLAAVLLGVCQAQSSKTCLCADLWAPVCALGRTFQNACVAHCYGVKTGITLGVCLGGADTSKFACGCNSIYSPVCGVKTGVTFGSICLAKCYGVQAFTTGQCSTQGFCGGKCETIQPHPTGCYCDKSCVANKDCCVDYTAYCSSTSSSPATSNPINTQPVMNADSSSSPLSPLNSNSEPQQLASPLNAPASPASPVTSQASPASPIAPEDEPVSPVLSSLIAPRRTASPSIRTKDPAASCSGMCGGFNTKGPCYCDRNCLVSGDCCADYLDSCSCNNRCGAAPQGRLVGCECNAACIVAQTCCPDYLDTCRLLPAVAIAGGGSISSLGGLFSPGSQVSQVNLQVPQVQVRPSQQLPTTVRTPQPTRAVPTTQPPTTQPPTTQPPTTKPSAAPAPKASCLGKCGTFVEVKVSPSDLGCYCEPGCKRSNDCCSDYSNVCLGG